MDAVSGAEGQWIADALERYIGKKGYFGAVAVVIPDQFEAYARIFHPVDEMNAQGPGLRWADLARSKNTVFHPEAQFHQLARTELYGRAVIDGRDVGQAPSGEMVQRELELLAEILAGHSVPSQDIFQAVWDGWGGFEPGRHNIPTGAGTTLTVAKGLRKYWVFRGSMAEFVRPPWFDAEWGHSEQTPNLAWPADRSWCMASEIDFDSTLVGGTAELISAVVHSSGLESLEVTPSSDLSWQGDTINV